MATQPPATQPQRGFLRVLFILFIGVFVALFISLGVEAFYPRPTYNVLPIVQTAPACAPGETKCVLPSPSPETAYVDYQAASQRHDRISTMILLAAAVILLVLSLTVLLNVDLIADGVLLGGVFTLFSAVFRAFGSSDVRLEFLASAVGLAITMVIAYRKFINPAHPHEPAA